MWKIDNYVFSYFFNYSIECLMIVYDDRIVLVIVKVIIGGILKSFVVREFLILVMVKLNRICILKC